MLPCVVESLTFPPVVPSSIGKGCACWFISCLTIVTVAAPDFVGSACAAAVTGTVAGLGTDEGAMYSPVEEIVPTVALPPVTPATLQVADNCFGYHLDRVRVLGPLQLFLARRQVGKEIL